MNKRSRVGPAHQSSLFELGEPENAVPSPISQGITRPFEIPAARIFLGTSSFTASGWEGSFYPLGMRSKDFLRHYASQFQTVEIDSTFYGTPAASTFTSWQEKTPYAGHAPATVKRFLDLWNGK